MAGVNGAPADADPRDGRPESEDQRADRNWNEILQELRVSQTGTQIISGFLLAVAFQPLFKTLGPFEVGVYAILVLLAAASTALGLATVSLHRMRFRQHDKPQLVSVGNRLLAITVVAVALLSAGVVLLIFDVVFGLIGGIIGGGVTAAGLIFLLVVLPRGLRSRRP